MMLTHVKIELSNIDDITIHLFLWFGIFYYGIKTIDTIRWWNGSDENGNPK